ncbi:MAG: DUF3365 domain-containing protein [Ignavibacteriae bacterium]|nr:MAG: DUF3365 domain-containing protein [Ignavibacteriota bacterium]
MNTAIKSTVLLTVSVLFIGWGSQQPDLNAIAASAQKELATKLKAALEAGGPIAALETCSVEALTITNQVAEQHGVSLRRATLRPRNPYNTANDLERTVLLEMEAKLRQRGVPDTVTIAVEDSVHVFYPIRIVEKPCMACHGSVETQITKETAAVIAERYPDDKATGYTPGELRGAWVISYKR